MASMLAVAATMGGCIPLPFATPPVKTSFLVGGGGGRIQVAPEQPATQRAAEVILGARVGLHPLQLFPSLLDRPFDVGIGYAFETFVGPGVNAPQLHGGYLEGTYWFMTSRPWPEHAFRFGVVAEADVLVSTGRDPAVGFGGSAGLSIELAKLTMFGFASDTDNRRAPAAPPAHDGRNGPTPEPRDDSDEGVLLGVGLGEVGIGASLIGGYRRVGTQENWVVLFRLDVRLPATAGVALIPL